MKRTQLILAIIISCIPCITFAMECFIELQQQPINTFKIETVTLIDEKINKEYCPSNELIDFFARLQLTKEDMLAIINLTKYWCEQEKSPITASLIDALCKKNTFFDAVIYYFIQHAQKNRDNVRYTTVDIVDDSTKKQPIPELNNIPQSIKEYVMQQVRNKVTFTYDIILPHFNTVRFFAVHPATDIAVTHTIGHYLRIWDLKTGTDITKFKENDPIVLIQFNQDGSLMGTAAPYTTRDNRIKSRIKIYNLLLQQQSHSIKQNDRVYHINFMQGSSDTIVATFAQEENNTHNRKDRILTLWQLNDAQKTTKICTSSSLPWRGEQLIEFLSDKDKYDGFINEDDDTKVCITKRQCATLHLCKQAMENNDDVNSLATIDQTQSYQRLTDYEKQLIQKDITEQKSLTEKNSLLHLTFPRK